MHYFGEEKDPNAPLDISDEPCEGDPLDIGPPCVHGDGRTLCPACRAEYAADPVGYLDFGPHPAGIARWRELEAEVAEYHRRNPPPPANLDELPF